MTVNFHSNNAHKDSNDLANLSALGLVIKYLAHSGWVGWKNRLNERSIREEKICTTTLINFTNILWAAFVPVDLKSVKIYWQLDWILSFLGDTGVKAVRKYVDEIEPLREGLMKCAYSMVNNQTISGWKPLQLRSNNLSYRRDVTQIQWWWWWLLLFLIFKSWFIDLFLSDWGKREKKSIFSSTHPPQKNRSFLCLFYIQFLV